jgi:hypothetical protein
MMYSNLDSNLKYEYLLSPPYHLVPPFLGSVPRAPGGVKWGDHRGVLAEAATSRHESRQLQAAIDRFGETSRRTRLIRSSRNYKKVTKIQRQFPGPLVLLHYKHGSSQMVGHSILVISLILSSRRHFSSFFPQNTPESAQSNIRPDVCKGSHQPFTINCKFLANSFVQVMQRLE